MSEAKENLDVKKSDDKETLKKKNEDFVIALAEKLGISDKVPDKGGLYYKAADLRINYKLDSGDKKKHAGLELVFRRDGIVADRDRLMDETASHKVNYEFEREHLYLVLSYCFECGEAKGDALMEQKCSRRFLFHTLFRDEREKDLPYKEEVNTHISRWFVVDCIDLGEIKNLEDLSSSECVNKCKSTVKNLVDKLGAAARTYNDAKEKGEDPDEEIIDTLWDSLTVRRGLDVDTVNNIARRVYDEVNGDGQNNEQREFTDLFRALHKEKRENYLASIISDFGNKKQKTKKENTDQMEENANYWIYRAESQDLASALKNLGLSEGNKIVCYYAEPGKAIRLCVKRGDEEKSGELEEWSIYLPLLCGTEQADNSLRKTLSNIGGQEKELKAVSEAVFNDIMQGIKKYARFNRILFGAPGTGKSYQLKKDVKASDLPEDQVERVTFHPEYSYFDFVGTYKPKMRDERIVYDFVPGPFTRTLKKALLNKDKAYLLIVEEINRARVAAVFGDMFQLLDRDEMGESEYGINPSEELKDYLLKEYYEKKRREKENPEADNTEEKYLAPEDVEKIRIPRNMYIWATMNSADQGVYPMDTAFKRRWNFEYMGIDKGEGAVKGKCAADWLKLRDHVNALLQKAGINEDKQMGPFFLKGTELEDEESFEKAVKNKVLMYLFEDATKHKRTGIFKGDVKDMRYSAICKKFEDAYVCKKGEDKGVKMSTALDSIFQPKV